MKSVLCVLLSIFCVWSEATADDFFDVETITFHHSAAQNEPHVDKDVPKLDANNQPVLDKNNKPIVDHVQVPFLVARVSVKEQVKAATVSAKAYFYDEKRQLIATDSAPSMTRSQTD